MSHSQPGRRRAGEGPPLRHPLSQRSQEVGKLEPGATVSDAPAQAATRGRGRGAGTLPSRLSTRVRRGPV